MQSKMINIPSYIEDPSYRYQMPSIQLRHEGKNTGIRTKIVNLSEIAIALRVPSTYALKFLGYELGSHIKESESAINGSFTEPQMKKLLDKFIEKYILCPSCTYPEMVLKIKQNKICGTCNCCRHRCVLDNTHKIASYIVKHPPKNNSEFDQNEDPDEDANENGKKGNGRKEGKKPKQVDKDPNDHNKKDDNEDERIKDIAPVLTFKDQEEEFIQKFTQVYQQHSLGVENFDDNPEEAKNIVQKAREIVTEEYLNKLPYIVFNSIFDLNIVKEISKNKAVLVEAYEQAKIRDAQLDTLLNLQKLLLVKLASHNFEGYIPTILKLFYDEDLLEEDILLDWDSGKLNPKLMMDFRFHSAVNERFKAAAKPVINWLKAEDDGEKYEADDSDIDDI